MIQLMTYLLVISILIGFAASISERICGRFGLPRRSVWLFALLASTLLPLYSVLSGAGSTANSAILSLPAFPDYSLINAAAPRIESTAGAAPVASSFSWPNWQILDTSLKALWLILSLGLLIWLGLGFSRIRSIIKQAKTKTIGKHTVLLTESTGPAVIGFLRPRILFPEWLATRDAKTTSPVLKHEQAHIAARDPLLLLLALFVVAAMPWNVALWWQLRRLRCAIEIDCDRRVIQQGANPRDYSNALFTIGKQSEGLSSRSLSIALALTEPKLELEKRISIMMNRLPKLGLTDIGGRLLLATTLLGLAMAVNVPRAQQAAGGFSHTTDWDAIASARRPVVSELLNEAEECLSDEDLECVRSNLDQVNAITDLSIFETVGIKNFEANVGYVTDDAEVTIAAYEEIIALPVDDAYESLVRGATRNLAMLYFSSERSDDGLEMYDRYLAWPGTTPTARDNYRLAMTLYQTDRFVDAIDPLEKAIELAEEPNKQYYSVLYVLQSEVGDEVGMLSTLEKLNAYWPEDTANMQTVLSDPESALTRLQSNRQYLPINSIQPAYPEDAIARGIEGSVLVKYTVAIDGTTKDVEVLESSAEIFVAAAIEAASQYQYRQRTINGTPVEVAGVTTLIEFTLPDGA